MSVARELVLEAVADKLGIEVTDDEIRERAARAPARATRTSRSSSRRAAPTASATTCA